MDDTPRPLTEHLEELRRRLFWIVGAWAVGAGVAGMFYRDVYRLLMRPAVVAVTEKGHTLVALAPPELFFTYLKSALLAGFLVSIPVTLYHLWSFVSPGLYPGEKRFALPFVVMTTLLFFGGCAFGYFVAFPFVFEYFLSLEADFVVTSWSTRETFSFLSRLYLAFGIAFQLPIAMFFLAVAGIVSPDALASGRKYAIVGMFAAGAILTPPDVVSQILLACPLILLYESGILVSRLVLRRREKAAAAPEEEAIG